MRFSGGTRRRLLVAVAVVVVAGLAGLVILRSGSDHPTTDAPRPVAPSAAGPSPTVAPEVPRPAMPAGPPCVASPGAGQQDVDTTDPPDAAWPRSHGQKIVVYFETGRLPPRYANAVVLGARLWSRSTCVQALATPRCPPHAQCSTIAMGRTGGDAGLAGYSEAATRDGQRVGNAITLYSGLLDTSTDLATLGTVVHEMGHALGLRHRKNPHSIMNATTGDDTDPRPDAIDFSNLAALYGERVVGARPG